MDSDVVAHGSTEKLVQVHKSASNKGTAVLRSNDQQVGFGFFGQSTNAASNVLSLCVDGLHLHAEGSSTLDRGLKNLVRPRASTT